MHYALPESKYGDIIILDDYNDELSLVAGRKYEKDGEEKTAMQWCFPQGKDREPRDKSVPWKIRLGSKEEAREFARWLWDQVGDTEGPEVPF